MKVTDSVCKMTIGDNDAQRAEIYTGREISKAERR